MSDFDTEVFGCPFYRLVGSDAARIVEALDALGSGPLMVDAKVSAEDSDLLHALEKAGFHRAATMVEFSATPASGAGPDPEACDSLVLEASDLRSHAEGFRFQRFRQDGRIPVARSVAFMERWIANSISGRRRTLAIARNFCTFSVADGTLTIDLLSCLDTGRGMAGRLLRSVHGIAWRADCREMRVTTEAENARAMRSYTSAGFRPAASHVALHLVRKAN